MRFAAPVLIAALAVGGCDRDTGKTGAGSATVSANVSRAAAVAGVTPMAERVAVLGFLNKRNGIVRDLTLKPGQAMRVKDVTIRLQACESTAPWEVEKLTGAFVQVDRLRPDGQWVRRFSGWLYKESPSLNAVEDAVYDVWPKSCAMSWPAGPAAPVAPSASSSRSSASNSGGGRGAEPPANEVGEAPPETEPAPSPAPPADNAEERSPIY